MERSVSATSPSSHAEASRDAQPITGPAASGPDGTSIDWGRRRLLLGGASLALATAVARAEAILARPLACAVPPRDPVPFGPPDPGVGWSAPPGAVPTTISVSMDGFIYHVGHQPETIRGMGYNPVVAGLTPEQRRARLQRDLSRMASAGVNTLLGWNPAAIDGLTLDVAYWAGIGVTLPFDVDFSMDVLDAAARSAFTTSVLAWVDQYKQHPALRIWALGNEVLQRSVPPAWCSSPPTEEQAAWSSAWSSLLLETADAIHERDPLHPVLYRESEDAYAPWLTRAIDANPADRPWLIYGVNAYTPRLGEILGHWPGHHIPTSLLVSEFAPPNAPRGERAELYREIWGVIRSFPAFVVGGAVYVWSTDGPEAIDQQLGLVDEHGTPVDDALDTIADLYTTADRVAAPARVRSDAR
jgi:hypothetical protein